MKDYLFLRIFVCCFLCLIGVRNLNAQAWQSAFVQTDDNGRLNYQRQPDGSVIPDFSAVGFEYGNERIPEVPVVLTLEPENGDNRESIQSAIERIGEMPLRPNGFRGTLLMKRGRYDVDGSVFIRHSGIVIRGEGNSDEDGTVVVETADYQTNLFVFKGEENFKADSATSRKVSNSFVPVGQKYIDIVVPGEFAPGDKVVIFRPGTKKWIHDLRMDNIAVKPGLKQWTPREYDLYYERNVVKAEGNTIWIDNPVVMELYDEYGGGYIMEYAFPGRIRYCGLENLFMKSSFKSDDDEAHGWNAVKMEAVEHSWVRNVTAQYFGYSCVNIGRTSKNISVISCRCVEAKSKITGGRRYSFNCDGQLNLFKDCFASDGRHDFVTGARACGPNVFTQCTARNTHNDIGPHHRWSTGTLYDLIDTDGDINVQDRGNWGTGHGWAGATQIIWNCKAGGFVVQSPWVSGKNYIIGSFGQKKRGRLPGRPDGVWEGSGREGLTPGSLYEAQLSDRKLKKHN